METLYGEIREEYINDYLEKTTNRIFKILPLSEEECPTVVEYVDSLTREIFGNSTIFFHDELLSISGTLRGLDFTNHKLLKSDVLKMCNSIKKIQKKVE